MPISSQRVPKRRCRHVSYGNQRNGEQVSDPTAGEIKLRCHEADQMRLALSEQKQRFERSRQDRIVRFVGQHGPQTSRAIEQATRSTVGHVRNDLLTLEQESRIVRTGGGSSTLYAIVADDNNADDSLIGMQPTSSILKLFRLKGEMFVCVRA